LGFYQMRRYSPGTMRPRQLRLRLCQQNPRVAAHAHPVAGNKVRRSWPEQVPRGAHGPRVEAQHNQRPGARGGAHGRGKDGADRRDEVGPGRQTNGQERGNDRLGLNAQPPTSKAEHTNISNEVRLTRLLAERRGAAAIGGPVPAPLDALGLHVGEGDMLVSQQI